MDISILNARKAIETVEMAISYMQLGPFIRRMRGKVMEVNVPLMYNGFVLDEIHINPETGEPSPKGCPVAVPIECQIRELQPILENLHAIHAVEFRLPENAWVVPLAWKEYIVAHVRVSADGKELMPDYRLTEEVRRNVM